MEGGRSRGDARIMQPGFPTARRETKQRSPRARRENHLHRHTHDPFHGLNQGAFDEQEFGRTGVRLVQLCSCLGPVKLSISIRQESPCRPESFSEGPPPTAFANAH